MNDDVDFIIPYRESPGRRSLLDWVCDRLPSFWIAYDTGEGEWSKGRTLWQALSRTERPIVVLHDADVWSPGLAEAVDAVRSGVKWARPHGIVYRLTEPATHRVLTNPGWAFRNGVLSHLQTERSYYGMTGGGIVVARREVLLEAPVDPRFLGWGQEDECHAMALWCLFGKPWQGVAPLYHLWHRPARRLDRRIGSKANWALRQRYVGARHDPVKMRELLAEVHGALEASVSVGDDRAAC